MVPRAAHAGAIHGRERELATLLALVRRGSARWVTITGAIGIGKTRLLECARVKLHAHDGDVVFLDGASGPRSNAARRVVVATSTAPLGVAGEIDIPLGALLVPETENATPSSLKRNASVAMLLDAARLDVDTLKPRTLRAIARLAIASDGHPAVLEQLAGWLSVLPAEDAVAALAQGSLRLLPAALERRLRGTAKRLSPSARDAVAALAETSAPFDLEVAQAVLPRTKAPVPSSIAELVSAGLLVRSGLHEHLRWHLPRPFGAVLRTAKGRRARRLLTTHYAELAAPLLPSITVKAHPALLGAHAEVVAAWEDTHARGDPAELPLAVALATLAWNGDPGVAKHAERLRASIRAHARSPHRPRLDLARGELLMLSGDAVRADALFTRAAAGARASGSADIEALARIRRATIGPELGHVETAHQELGRAFVLARGASDPLLLELALNAKGLLLRATGDIHGALAAFGEEAEVAGLLGNPVAIARSEAGAADCHLVLGETALARLRYERALRAIRRLYPGWARTFEGYIGLAAWEAGAFTEAVAHWRHALGGELSPRFEVMFHAARAGALAELGDVARAARALSRAEALLARADAEPSRRAVHAAALLVTLASATDETSRAAPRARIEAHLASRDEVLGDEQRAFVRALARAVGAPAAQEASLLRPGALRGRPLLEKVLGVLREAQGKPVRPAVLFRAVWPGDHGVATKQAEARVRKAISLLRDLGLHGAIVTSERGYVLRPHARSSR